MRYTIFIFTLIMLAACARSPEYRTAAGTTWGTTYHITYKADCDLHDSIREQMRMIDMSLSPFVDSSLIARINRGENAPCDSYLRDVMALSLHVCSISGGAFDPTLAPLINLWGFGYRNTDADTPSQAQIDSALSLVGIRQCHIDANGMMHKKAPRTEFNFSAVAKGYGVDRVAEMLRRNGCTDYMVEIGGEIALSGANPRGNDWKIQIDAPIETNDGISHDRLKIVALTDRCIATSGNYRNFRHTAEGGKAYHTISPVTGRPINSGVLSATIIAPSCALADALATTTMAMPDTAAIPLLRTIPNISAIIVLSDSTLVEF